ncbi:unnamed protein product [Urochloa humidicola]
MEGKEPTPPSRNCLLISPPVTLALIDTKPALRHVTPFCPRHRACRDQRWAALHAPDGSGRRPVVSAFPAAIRWKKRTSGLRAFVLTTTDGGHWPAAASLGNLLGTATNDTRILFPCIHPRRALQLGVGSWCSYIYPTCGSVVGHRTLLIMAVISSMPMHIYIVSSEFLNCLSLCVRQKSQHRSIELSRGAFN